MHYWRLSPDSWRTGLRELKGLGLPIVETYAPWGVHEPEPGVWDFGETDPRKDLGRFLDLAAEEGLYAFVRPGPHINAEMTYFGLPRHIVHDPQMQARSPSGRPVFLFFPPRMFPVPSHASEAYHAAVHTWFAQLTPILAPRVHSASQPEGNVVLLQVDNEVGYFFRNGPFCQDYHPDALALWREFLTREHGTAEAANEAHRREAPITTEAADDRRGGGPSEQPVRASQDFSKEAENAALPEEAPGDAVRTPESKEEPDNHSIPALDHLPPPKRFAEGVWGEVPSPGELTRQLDWAHFQEWLLTHAVGRMAASLTEVGLGGLPRVHNVSLGEGGLQASVPALGSQVDLVGLDYYHPAREHATVKRRTLYLEGCAPYAYAPELGVGAPPWFTPLAHRDSLYTAMCALAFGLRGFNLYMAVDRDRWYGAAIDARGRPRPEAVEWRRLNHALQATDFHRLRRHVSVALMLPREYARLARQTHLLGPLSPSTLEAVGGTPVDACRGDTLGFAVPIQRAYWRDVDQMARALTAASIPYRYVDSDSSSAQLERHALIVAPSYEYADVGRWQKLQACAAAGTRVVVGPRQPTLDACFQPLELPAFAEPLLDLRDPIAIQAAIHRWVEELTLPRPCPVAPPLEATLHTDPDSNEPRVLFVCNPTTAHHSARVSCAGAGVLRDALNDERFTGGASLTLPMPPLTVRMLVVEAAP